MSNKQLDKHGSRSMSFACGLSSSLSFCSACLPLLFQVCSGQLTLEVSRSASSVPNFPLLFPPASLLSSAGSASGARMSLTFRRSPTPLAHTPDCHRRRWWLTRLTRRTRRERSVRRSRPARTSVQHPRGSSYITLQGCGSRTLSMPCKTLQLARSTHGHQRPLATGKGASDSVVLNPSPWRNLWLGH